MSSVMSEIHPITRKLFALELLKIAVLNLVSAIETTFLNQSEPKMYKVFIGIGSRMSSIMSEIRPVTRKLFALEWFRIAVLNLVSAVETTFLNQSGPKMHKVFICTRSRIYSIMNEICQVTQLFALQLLKIVVYVCIFFICHRSSTCIYWRILIWLHKNVGYDNILSKFNFQGPGLKVKVTVAIFRKVFSLP